MALDHPSPLEQAARALSRADTVLVITGAGISVESGLPTYRGTGGVYENNPELPDFLSAGGWERTPEAVWDYVNQLRLLVAAARPNDGHRVLARWETEGRFTRFLIATQNVDGLHQAAGSDRVSELHGSLWRLARPRPEEDYTDDEDFSSAVEDLLAGNDPEENLRRWSLEDGRNVWEDRTVPFPRIPPHPDAAVRPDILLFGESYGTRLMWVKDFIKRAPQAVLLIGSSGQVAVVDALLHAALMSNPDCIVIDINPHSAPVSQAHLHLRMPASEALLALDAAWEKGLRPSS